jgi:hypothetical protein
VEESFEHLGYRVNITLDYSPENPRDGSNISKLYIPRPPRNCSWSELSDNEALEIEGEVVIKVPLFALDHSGYAISTEPFNDPWDSWHCGFAYVTSKSMRGFFSDEDRRENYGKCLAKAKEMVNEEVEVFNKYLNSEVYCYEIYDKNETFVHGCCGYYSTEDAIADAKESIECEIKNNSPLFLASGINPITLKEKNE